ncbi:hypothetical protein CSE16_09930 [Solibacillus sp. R5-41]|nr:hypothetical protein CSE16_09930 [Solibacillus sp. R5-41]
MIKLKKILLLIGFLFMMLYGVYIAGYSTSPIFKYALLIGMLFWSVELLIQTIGYSDSLVKKIRVKCDTRHYNKH